MAQPLVEEAMNTWPSSLLLSPPLAAALSCTKCNEVPVSPRTNDEGDILCAECAKQSENVSVAKVVKKMVNKLKTKCLSLSPVSPCVVDCDEQEGSKMIATSIKDSQCEWTGMIGEWTEHSQQCAYLVISCDTCHSFKCPRKAMQAHLAECPEKTIQCPLSCGAAILRKNTESHLAKDCMEQVLDCIHEDCHMQIKRKAFKKHVENECAVRVLECEFVKYGCTEKNIKASAMKAHLEEYKFDHISWKFDFITNEMERRMKEQEKQILSQKLQQQQMERKTKEQEKRISSQQQTISDLQQQSAEQRQLISSMQQQFNAKMQDQGNLIQSLQQKFDEAEEKKQEIAANVESAQILAFSTEYKSATGLELSDNNKCVKAVASAHKYILVDAQPVTSGIHCWRWCTKQSSDWVFWGVSSRKKHSDRSFSDQGVYGMAGYDQTLNNGQCSSSIQTTSFFSKAEVAVDMLLDLQAGEMKFTMPGTNTEIQLHGIPKGNTSGFLPHCNLHYKNMSVEIKKIPKECYGKLQ